MLGAFLRARSRSLGCVQTSKYARLPCAPILPPGSNWRTKPLRMMIGSNVSPNGTSPK